MQNNNRKVIQRLSARSLKSNKIRNLFAVTAISLTCMLFTVLASIGMGMIQITQEQTMREVGTRCHAGLKSVTQEQMETILQDARIQSSSWNILLGTVDNLWSRSGEIRLAGGKEELENAFIKISEGNYPQAEDEILVDTLSLDEWKLPYQVGEKVTLSFQFLGEKIEKEFTVSGWYEGDRIAHASELYISEAYWEELRGDWTDEDFVQWDQESLNKMGIGLYNVGIYFSNAARIEDNICSVILDAGYEPDAEVEYGVNWAYLQNRTEGIDMGSLLLLGAVLIVVLVTGYLIICNIFLISITQDIRFYGLLKTIGTTKKQIRRLIRRQSLVLSAVGIPIGLAIGFLIAKVFFPLLMSVLNLNGMKVVLHFHPAILLFGIIFSLFTVLISCRKPGKIAGSVSPMEAVRYSEGTIKKRKDKHSTNGAKVHRMALSNLGRNKKKTIFVILSLSLSVILLCIVFTGVESFQVDQYLEQRLVGDVMVGSLRYTGSGNTQVDANLDQEMIAYLDSQPGIEQSAELWMNTYDMPLKLDEKGKQRYENFYKQGILGGEDSEWDKVIIERALENSEVQTDVYGYDSNLLNNLNVKRGKLNIEKFEQGGYILLTSIIGDNSEDCLLYEPGDKVTISYAGPDSVFEEIKDEEGNIIDGYWSNLLEREYEVMAVIETIPYSMNSHSYCVNGVQMVLPKKDFQQEAAEGMLLGRCFEKSYKLNEESLDNFLAAVQNYTETQNRQMGYVTKNTLKKEFNGMIHVIRILGISLGIVIAVISLLNFINSIFTGIVARKREFAILSSIGMTEQQLKKMLLEEGLYYVLISGVLSIVFGSLLAYGILNALNNIIAFFEYHYSFTAFVIVLPLFLIMAVIIPQAAYTRIKRKSIVERLRDTES